MTFLIDTKKHSWLKAADAAVTIIRAESNTDYVGCRKHKTVYVLSKEDRARLRRKYRHRIVKAPRAGHYICICECDGTVVQ
jgi:hypothetical protein